jgi:hypothetical protein
MSTNRLDDVGGSAQQAAACLDGYIVEVPFLLPDWQVAALETAAHGDCLTGCREQHCHSQNRMSHWEPSYQVVLK